MEKWRKWVVSDPSVMIGKPVIAGTRITVELITVDDLLEAHPRLAREAIQAAPAFAAEALRADVVYPRYGRLRKWSREFWYRRAKSEEDNAV